MLIKKSSCGRLFLLPMFPLVFLLAGAAFTAPVALADHSELELSSNPETLGAYVREYYADIPIMADIAWCESRMRHIGSDGTIIKNPNSSAIGVMQIMSSIHDPIADELGLDITTLDGNLAYARHLYEKQGTQPWDSSKKCWGQIAQNKQSK